MQVFLGKGLFEVFLLTMIVLLTRLEVSRVVSMVQQRLIHFSSYPLRTPQLDPTDLVQVIASTLTQQITDKGGLVVFAMTVFIEQSIAVPSYCAHVVVLMSDLPSGTFIAFPIFKGEDLVGVVEFNHFLCLLFKEPEQSLLIHPNVLIFS